MSVDLRPEGRPAHAPSAPGSSESRRVDPGDVDRPTPPRHPERTADRHPGGGGRTWLLQVGTGVALLVLVVAHLVAQHFVVDAPGGLRDHDSVLAYLAHPVLLGVEVAFLLAVTWHAMLGLRSIALDLGLGPVGRRRVAVALTVLGLVTVVYGVGLLVVLLA